jgi:2-hydroxychromene-2-carboxylate isomerase
MENMLETITCFFNFRSPYAYLGVRKALEKNLKFKFIPVCYLPKELLKFLEDAAENEYKRSYFFEDCERLFEEIGIKNVSKIISKEANWPKVHASWLCAEENGFGDSFMLEAFNARWKNNLDIGKEDIIEEICNKIGFSKDLALSAMNDDGYDKQLKSFTKIMRENKVFGVPTFLYKNERFWGQDRIEILYNRISEDK